jgi:hypothetical protein
MKKITGLLFCNFSLGKQKKEICQLSTGFLYLCIGQTNMELLSHYDGFNRNFIADLPRLVSWF